MVNKSFRCVLLLEARVADPEAFALETQNALKVHPFVAIDLGPPEAVVTSCPSLPALLAAIRERRWFHDETDDPPGAEVVSRAATEAIRAASPPRRTLSNAVLKTGAQTEEETIRAATDAYEQWLREHPLTR
jgi:hypothetical protein